MLTGVTLNLLQFILVLVSTVVGGGFGLWNLMSSKIDKANKVLEARLHELETNSKNYLDKDMFKTSIDGIMARLDRMDIVKDNYVKRDEFIDRMGRLEGVLEKFATSASASTATLTSRMDSILFEIGKRNERAERNER